MNGMINIGNRIIGKGQSPFMIAEVSCNHMGSIEQAKKIMKTCAEAGADALKLQTYEAQTLTMDAPQEHFMVDHPLWNNTSLYDLYKKGQTPFEWMEPLFDYGHELGVVTFSAPFDLTAADLLISLDAPLYKIASFEIVHIPLIRKVASSGKPLIMSTGMASEAEIELALSEARKAGAKDIVLLHCVSSYPTPIEQANLRTIEMLREKYGVLVGLSDHTKGTLAAEIAVGLGACMVEKHVMLNKDDDCLDKAFSLTPEEFAELVSKCKAQDTTTFEARLETKEVQVALGEAGFKLKDGERDSAVFRPSILFARNLKAGDTLKAEDLIVRRPSAGLAPKELENLIGLKMLKDVSRGDATRWECFKQTP